MRQLKAALQQNHMDHIAIADYLEQVIFKVDVIKISRISFYRLLTSKRQRRN